MKNNLLSKALLTGSLLAALSVHSQDNERSGYDHGHDDYDYHDHHEHAYYTAGNIYVVTDSVKNGTRWNFLRMLDEKTGAFSNILFRLLSNSELQVPPGTAGLFTSNGVAAIALDKKNKKLFYTPMLTDKLYYLDLKTMTRYLVTNRFTGLLPKANDQGNIITRMVIGDDDKGYTLTNDGRHLIRFRTNTANPDITDMGSLVDARGNDEMSVHNLCSSYGGDLIADDDNQLYLVTSRNHVFKIAIQTKVTKYIGTVSGLPANFTTSGVAADNSGERIIITGSSDSSGIYAFKIKNLIAGKLSSDKRTTADLANDEMLESENHYPGHHQHRFVFDANPYNDRIRLYPNPVIDKEFKIRFTGAEAGSYTIRVMDVNGNTIVSRVVQVNGKDNIVSFKLPGTISTGIYMVGIASGNNKPCYNGKIFVQ